MLACSRALWVSHQTDPGSSQLALPPTDSCASLCTGQGSDSLHCSLRQQVVGHIRENEEQFKPFVEDDETFEVYCKRMGKVGADRVRERVDRARCCFVYDLLMVTNSSG